MNIDMIYQNITQVVGQAIGNGMTPDTTEALSFITEDMITQPDLKEIFNSLNALIKNGVIVDIESVHQMCNGIDFGYLAQMVGNCHDSSQVVSYAKQAKKAFKTQMVANELQCIATEMLDRGIGAESFSDRLSELSGEVDFSFTEKSPVSMEELARGYVDIFEGRALGNIEHSSLDIGLDVKINRTDLLVVGGLPGCGKTALMMYILNHIAMQGKKSLVFSLEMEDMQLFEREVSRHGMVSLSELKDPLAVDTKRISQDALNGLVTKGVAAAMNMPVYIDDSANITIHTLKAKVRRFLEEHPDTAMICIDYLTLMSLPKAERRDLSVGEVTRQLKLLAKDIKVPIMCLSQMNRQASQQKREPENSDLRDSGSIEQDADKIIFPHRERDGANEGLCKVLKRKVRDGEVGHKTLGFNFGNLYETDKEWQDEKPEEPKNRKPYGAK